MMPRWLRNISTGWTLVWFIIRDFLHSSWGVFNALAILFVQLFLLGVEPSRVRYFGIVYMFMLGLSAVNTMALFSRANGYHTYPILARPVTRTTYVAATMFASWIIGVAAYVVMSVLAYLRYGPPVHEPAPDWFALSTYLLASVAVVVAITFGVSLMSLLSAFVSPFWLRIVVLALISLLVMSFDPRTFPVPALTPVIAYVPPLLAPIGGAVHLATDGVPDALARASIIILAAYTSTLLALVLWLSTRREIVLE
jgi:hypothetical protein